MEKVGGKEEGKALLAPSLLWLSLNGTNRYKHVNSYLSPTILHSRRCSMCDS